MFKQYRHINHDEFIVVGGDTAAGGLDYSALQFLSVTNLDVPLVYNSKKMASEMTRELFPVLNKIFDVTGYRPVVAYERNAGGVFELEQLNAYNRANKYEVFKMPNYGRVDAPEAVKYGWDTNTATRPKMLSDLKEAVDKKLITIYDRETINQMFSFVIVQTSSSWKAQAESNSHDDLVMALAIAWQLYQLCPRPSRNQIEQDARNVINRRLEEEF